MPPPPATDWIARGGAFWLIFGGWGIIASIFVVRSVAFSRRPGHEADGCLLSFASIILTLFGGGIGLLLAKFPNNVFTALLGALILPSIVTTILMTRSRR